MSPEIMAISTYRKLVRRLNWMGLFIELGGHALPWAVLAGYTRSGTTFLGRVLSNILHARPIHEPENPATNPEVHFFNAREALSTIEASENYQQAILASFSRDFRGTRLTNTGSRLIYDGRIVKIVRGNHYLGYLSEMFQHCPFVVIMRNPCACIASRLNSGWPIPDHSHSFRDIEPLLSADQADSYLRGGSVITRFAVSWCLDNFMVLQNSNRRNFIFVHYENIITNPESELTKILIHIDREDCISRITKELAIECSDTRDIEYLTKWKAHLNGQEISEVRTVLQTFKLDHYYDLETGMPLGEMPFSSY